MNKYEPFTRLLEVRKLIGLTREELGEKANVDPMTIFSMETGRTNYKDAKLSTLLALCKGLGIKLVQLFPDEKNIA